MRKCVVGAVMAVIMTGVSAQAAVITEIQLAQITGANADFDSVTGELTWSGGFGLLLQDTLGMTYGAPGATVNVTATMDNMTDNSGGGTASASFASGSFIAVVDDGVNTLATIGGTLKSGFTYDEIALTPTSLFGSSVIEITAFSVHPIVEAFFGGPVDWAGGVGDTAGLIATSTIDLPGITDYQSDWDSNNVIITVLADESVIPEPATLTLLGLGGLGLIRRRKVA